MNLSAILVVTRPEEIDRACEVLEERPGVEVHHVHRETGRLIITQEAETIDDEVDGLGRIQELPFVILAEMVEHHFAPESPIVGDEP